jgi:ribonuclease P protein subunit POP4
MKTIVIRGTRTWRIAKKNAVFKFNINGKPVKVEGKALIGRPENRVKKKTKKRW